MNLALDTRWGRFPQAAVPRYQVRLSDNKTQRLRAVPRTTTSSPVRGRRCGQVARLAYPAFSQTVVKAVTHGLKQLALSGVDINPFGCLPMVGGMIPAS